MSALGTSATPSCSRFGFSPADARLGAARPSPREGAVEMMRVADVGRPRRHRRTASPRSGYDRARRTRTGSGSAAPDLLPGIGAELTPELQYFALDADDARGPGLRPGALPRAGAGGRTRRRRTDGDARRRRRTPRASRWPRRSTTAPTRASSWRWRRPTTTTRPRPTSWSTAAGGVQPAHRRSRCGRCPAGDLRVGDAGSRTDDQARTNADARAQLAAGPAPGQGGDFSGPLRGGAATRRRATR